MAKKKKKDMSELDKARLENAGYAGSLARWGDLTGNVPPFDVNRSEWLKEAFKKHLDQLTEQKNDKQCKKAEKPKRKKKATGNKGDKN